MKVDAHQPGPLPPVAEPNQRPPSLSRTRNRRARAGVAGDVDPQRAYSTLVERALGPVQAKPAVDTRYGDLIAAARAPLTAGAGEEARTPRASGQRATQLAKANADGPFGYGALLAAAPRGPDATGMPAPVRAKMEHALGADFSDVRLHPGSTRAAELGALAFTQGSDIHVAPGQWAPETTKGQELLGHELGHVLQQRAGRVTATAQRKGVELNDDPALEAEADAMGARAARGDAAQGRTPVAPGRSGEAPEERGADGARAGLLYPRGSTALAESGAGGVVVQHKAAAGPRSAGAVVQCDLRDTARQHHEARGVDTPAGGGGGQHGSFQDMAEDDTGPAIRHDHGHLDDGSGNLDESRREEPTWGDHIERLKWIAKLELGEALRPDLVDGTAAYRHFLFGGGATRDIEYGRFLENDSSGQTVLASAIEDTRQAALERHDQDVAGAEPTEGTQTYRIRTGTMSVTSGDARYPYPATENWQKAIGAHTIWIEANVAVTVTRLRDPASERPGGVPTEGEMSSSESGPPTFSRSFEVEMTIHAEDMYNFNPGAADIATGAPDSANGRFEITGLGHEYLNRGTFTHSFQFTATMDPVDSPAHSASPSDPGRSTRSGRPADRRRAYPTTR
ncbi:eCIS core domain-containing protein [Sorangium sp. So ce861]|uniref:eCIS core domain-containing protein n=1 Tax=Sorangium sp. So ce861 TaxID=3133323 RepID=UPI003F604C77